MEIKKTYYTVEIRPREMEFLDRLRELIRKRTASRDLVCCECDKTIERGSFYIRDKFWYRNFNYCLGETIKTRVNFICLDCWKGDVPEGRSTNWRFEDRLKWSENRENVCWSI